MNYIFESSGDKSVIFNFNGKEVPLESNGIGPLYSKVAKWAYENGFRFPYTSGPYKVLSMDEAINKMNITSSLSSLESDFHKIGEDKYLVRLSNADKNERAITTILTDLGVKDIKANGFNLRYRVKRFGDLGVNQTEETPDIEKMTFSKAAQVILQDNDNKPMTSSEIWDEISARELVETGGLTPKASLNVIMLAHSDNSNIKKKSKTKLFTIVDFKEPYRFQLINPVEIQDVKDDVEENDDVSYKYYLLGAYDKGVGTGQKSELWKTYVNGGYWMNGFSDGTDNFKLKDEVIQIPVGANVAIKSTYVRGKVNPVIMIKARGVVTKNYGDGTKIDVDWEDDFKPFEIQRNDMGAYRQTLHDISNKQEHIDLIFNSESNTINSDEDKVVPFVRPRVYSKNPFGGVLESSTLCILGKSGSGKTTSTEIALDEMEHEYEIMIPIEGEYTFSQFTGQGFEMSSFGEFLMRANNNPNKCYTAIFDECHRPITINKLNTELLQALSRKRNRDGKRFITMDRSTKRMYLVPSDEFPIPLTEERGKILIPDNFGIICLSSNPAIICRNPDFLNRVDLVVFTQSDRDVKDLTELPKLKENQKNIETIRGLFESDGKQEL